MDTRALAEIIESHTGTDGTFTTSMPRVYLLRSSQPTRWSHTLYEPSICFVAQGTKIVESAGHKLTYNPGSALAVASALLVKGRVTDASEERPFLCVRIELDVDLIQRRAFIADIESG